MEIRKIKNKKQEIQLKRKRTIKSALLSPDRLSVNVLDNLLVTSWLAEFGQC